MYYSLIIVIPIIILTGFHYYRKSKKETARMAVKEKKETFQKAAKTVEEEQETESEKNLRTSHDLSKQCIRLLGDFTARDRNGEDISNLFTRKLQYLLTLLIFSTEEHPAGISGDVINERLWPHKNKLDARNNRNVSLSKLRNILDRIGDISIVNEGNYWNIVFGKDVLCDYHEILAHYRFLKSNRLKDEFHLDLLLSLLCRGVLLNQTDIDWINHYKGRFSYQTVEMLASLLNDPGITDSEFRIRIVDTLLQHDHINEEAFRIKCLLLYESGKMEDMKSCFNAFRVNYSNSLGIHYGKTLKEVLKEGGAL